MLIPGSAMILGSAVTTTVWSIAVKKTPTQATLSAASATRFSRLSPIARPGVASLLNELVICCGEKRWAKVELLGAAWVFAPPAPASPATAGALLQPSLRTRAHDSCQ